MPPIDIHPRDLDFVLGVLRAHVPDREVWAFGSRVTGTSKKFSDFDLAILGEATLPTGVMADLADAFSESDLPFKVDVVDWAATSPTFRRIIQENHVVMQVGLAPPVMSSDI